MDFRKIICFALFIAAFAHAEPTKLVIVGGGHVGLITAVLAHKNAQKAGEELHITIYEQNQRITDTTATNIWNSHTNDEILAVVPQGAELDDKLKIPFDQPGGIKVDVKGVNDSLSARRFKKEVNLEGLNKWAHQRRTELLLQLGRAGMEAWKHFFDNAEDSLKEILKSSNFNPCCENDGACAAERFKGYRIDLIYGMAQASSHTDRMVKTYTALGYKRSQLLSPDEVEARDSSLAHFCQVHSIKEKGARRWKSDTSAVWRPGGCLDTQQFLPKLVTHLTTAMGTYVNKQGEIKNRFVFELDKKVTGVIFARNAQNRLMVKDLMFVDGSLSNEGEKYENVRYIFAPGESVGTLERLGFVEPAYAGFAGASLSLEIDIPDNLPASLNDYNHYMEVHRPGTVLAWQGRIRDGKIFLGGAGTKAFYGQQRPNLDEPFARVKNLLQLQMFNDVVPDLVSLALGHNSFGQQLSFADLDKLVQKGIARRWVGLRSVAFDNFPTAGMLYHGQESIANALATTHLGSGGGSFSLIMAMISTYAVAPERMRDELASFGISTKLAEEVLRFADSRRHAGRLKSSL